MPGNCCPHAGWLGDEKDYTEPLLHTLNHTKPSNDPNRPAATRVLFLWLIFRLWCILRCNWNIWSSPLHLFSLLILASFAGFEQILHWSLEFPVAPAFDSKSNVPVSGCGHVHNVFPVHHWDDQTVQVHCQPPRISLAKLLGFSCVKSKLDVNQEGKIQLLLWEGIQPVRQGHSKKGEKRNGLQVRVFVFSMIDKHQSTLLYFLQLSVAIAVTIVS